MFREMIFVNVVLVTQVGWMVGSARRRSIRVNLERGIVQGHSHEHICMSLQDALMVHREGYACFKLQQAEKYRCGSGPLVMLLRRLLTGLCLDGTRILDLVSDCSLLSSQWLVLGASLGRPVFRGQRVIPA